MNVVGSYYHKGFVVHIISCPDGSGGTSYLPSVDLEDRLTTEDPLTMTFDRTSTYTGAKTVANEALDIITGQCAMMLSVTARLLKRSSLGTGVTEGTE